MTHLFSPLPLREVVLANRIAVSPMCTYSAGPDGQARDWHLVHLGSRADGGAGLIIQEATAVQPAGRISPQDLGLWHDEQIAPLARINHYLHAAGSVAGIQLAHAGRKGSVWAPGGTQQGAIPQTDGGWTPVAPSAIAFDPSYATPRALTQDEIRQIIADFAAATQRALAADYRVIELHAAHGYLLHQFLSPLSNHRSDAYGGSFENRIRLTIQAVQAVRAVIPERLPLLVRLSATDWIEPGWTLEETIDLVRRLKQEGVDLVDVSSGGGVASAPIPVGPGYQVPLSARINAETGMATGTVGLITAAAQAEQILATKQADLILLGRELLRDPYWPLHAARELDVQAHWPKAYLRAAPRHSLPRQPQ